MWNRVQITTRISGWEIRKSRAHRCCHLHFFFLLILTLWCREWNSLSLNLLAKRAKKGKQKNVLSERCKSARCGPHRTRFALFGNWSQSRHGPTWKCSIVIRTARTQSARKGRQWLNCALFKQKKKCLKCFRFWNTISSNNYRLEHLTETFLGKSSNCEFVGQTWNNLLRFPSALLQGKNLKTFFLIYANRSLQSTQLGHIPPRLFAHLPNLHTL